MRTTLTIDDKIARELKEVAYRSGKSYKEVVNETLRAGLVARGVLRKAKRYRLKPTSMGPVMPGYDLDQALELAGHLEDQEIARKLALRK